MLNIIVSSKTQVTNMKVSDRVPKLLMFVMIVSSLLASNSALASASNYTYYLNGPIVRVNSNSLQGVSHATVSGVAFKNFQEIGDTVSFRGNSTVRYQTDNTTNTTVQVWLSFDPNEAGPSWGDFNFSWFLIDNSANYPAGIIVASSNFTANLTGDLTLVSDSAPTKSTFINSTDTVQLAIQCTSTSVNQEFFPGWWLSSNSSQDTNPSSVNIPVLQQSAIPELPFGMLAVSAATITVLVAHLSRQKLKRRKTIPNPLKDIALSCISDYRSQSNGQSKTSF